MGPVLFPTYTTNIKRTKGIGGEMVQYRAEMFCTYTFTCNFYFEKKKKKAQNLFRRLKGKNKAEKHHDGFIVCMYMSLK